MIKELTVRLFLLLYQVTLIGIISTQTTQHRSS